MQEPRDHLRWLAIPQALLYDDQFISSEYNYLPEYPGTSLLPVRRPSLYSGDEFMDPGASIAELMSERGPRTGAPYHSLVNDIQVGFVYPLRINYISFAQVLIVWLVFVGASVTGK
jgi:hypothetical protein